MEIGMAASLEERFHEEMLNIHANALRHCRYDARTFLRMVTDHRGLEAARRLLATPYLPDGFAELWQRGRLDLTMESLITKEPWSSLFTDEQPCCGSKAPRMLSGWNNDEGCREIPAGF